MCTKAESHSSIQSKKQRLVKGVVLGADMQSYVGCEYQSFSQKVKYYARELQYQQIISCPMHYSHVTQL